MTNLNDKMSHRKFLQMTAGAAIGAAMLNMPGMSFAAGAKVKAAICRTLLRWQLIPNWCSFLTRRLKTLLKPFRTVRWHA